MHILARAALALSLGATALAGCAKPKSVAITSTGAYAVTSTGARMETAQ